MDKTAYHNKIDAPVNDKQTYKELKRDPTPTLQRELNITLLTLKKTNAIDTQRYYRLRCSVPQPPKLYGLPKLHKPGFPMRPIVSFCGSPTYQLSKYLTTILQPLTDKSRRNLQSTEDFINATKTVEIPDDYEQKLWCRTLSTCRQTIPLWLRYVDDTFTAVRHDEIDAFHHHLDEQNTDIQFTREVEENGKLPFLVCLVSRDNTELPAILSHRRSTIETYPFISMQYDRQLIRRELTSTLTVFFQRTITTKNSSNVTLTGLLLLPKLTTTQLLRPPQLYHTQTYYHTTAVTD